MIDFGRLLEVMIKPPIDWPANRGPIADGVRIFNAVAGHETGNRVAFNFLLNSWSDLSKKYVFEIYDVKEKQTNKVTELYSS